MLAEVTFGVLNTKEMNEKVGVVVKHALGANGEDTPLIDFSLIIVLQIVVS